MEPNRIYYESMPWGSHFQPELQIGNGTSLRNGLKHPSYCYSAQSTFILQRKKRHLTKKPLKRKRHRMAAPLTNNVDN